MAKLNSKIQKNYAFMKKKRSVGSTPGRILLRSAHSRLFNWEKKVLHYLYLSVCVCVCVCVKPSLHCTAFSPMSDINAVLTTLVQSKSTYKNGKMKKSIKSRFDYHLTQL